MAMACNGGRSLIDAPQFGEAVILEVEAGERHETVLDNAAFTPSPTPPRNEADATSHLAVPAPLGIDLYNQLKRLSVSSPHEAISYH